MGSGMICMLEWDGEGWEGMDAGRMEGWREWKG